MYTVKESTDVLKTLLNNIFQLHKLQKLIKINCIYIYTAEESTDIVNTLWNYIFYDFDLNHDGFVAAAEIIVCLEKDENFHGLYDISD